MPLSQILTIGRPEVTIGVEDEQGPYLFSRSDATESLGAIRGNTAYLRVTDPYPTLRRRSITFR